MNWDQLRKLEYKHVRIRPVARRFADETGRQELRPIDGDWLVGRIHGKCMPISYAGYGITLTGGHIYGWDENLEGERSPGFLRLTVQVHLGGNTGLEQPGITPGIAKKAADRGKRKTKGNERGW